jgi:hypothetical protein
LLLLVHFGVVSTRVLHLLLESLRELHKYSVELGKNDTILTIGKYGNKNIIGNILRTNLVYLSLNRIQDVL